MEKNQMATAKKAPTKTAAKTAGTDAPAKKAASKKAAAGAAPAKKRTPNAAFLKALTPSPALAAIVGSDPLPRTEVTKKVWEYIKKHNLQDPTSKRIINADATLKEVLGKPKTDMFEMTKLVNSHLS
jgi:upstream activation factor subunit UAF30